MVPAMPLDLIDADGLDPIELPIEDTPENREFHRLEHGSPTGVEDAGDFVPGEAFGPLGQEPAVSGGLVAFFDRPWHTLHRHSATRAVHSPHRVDEEHGDLPQRHELETPLGQVIVNRSLAATAGTDWSAVGPGPDRNLDRSIGRAAGHFGLFVHEGLERFDQIEDSFQLHPVLAPGEMVVSITPSLPGNRAGCTFG